MSTRRAHPKQHTRPHKANPETSGTRRKGDVMNAQMCDNESGRRGAGNTTGGLTHHSSNREGGLS